MANVLVIEDEQQIRENIIEALELSGHTAQGAYNGLVGVELARRMHPDLVLCDVMMDGLDGFGVLETLRRDEELSSVPFIFLTALADRQSMRQGMLLGADDYLSKPFTPDELIQAVETRLARQEIFQHKAEEDTELARQRIVQLITEQVQRPLDGVKTVLEMTSAQLGLLQPDELQQMLDTAAYGSRRVSRLVEQIGYLARLELEQLSTHSVARLGQIIPFRDLWMMALDRARGFIDERIDVTVQIEEGAHSADVLCEEDAMRHALAEIIANGLQNAAERGTVTLTQWLDDGQVWFSVADDGPGLSNDVYEKAIAGKGTGLGLYLALRIIEAHSGQLNVYIQPGTGAVVTVSVPRA
jgi:DNA-binding response OmpR family regulator